jgi:hypothetical protein
MKLSSVIRFAFLAVIIAWTAEATAQRKIEVLDPQVAGISLTVTPSAKEIVVYEPLVVTLSLRNDSSTIIQLSWAVVERTCFEVRDEKGIWKARWYSPGWHELGGFIHQTLHPGESYQWDEVLFWNPWKSEMLGGDDARTFREKPFVFAEPGKRVVRAMLLGTNHAPLRGRPPDGARILYADEFEISVLPAEDEQHRRAVELIRSEELGRCFSRFCKDIPPEARQAMKQLLEECPTAQHTDYARYHLALECWHKAYRLSSPAELEAAAQMVEHLRPLGRRIPAFRHRRAFLTLSVPWTYGIREREDFVRLKEDLAIEWPLVSEMTHERSFPTFRLEELRRGVRGKEILYTDDPRLDELVDLQVPENTLFKQLADSLRRKSSVALDFGDYPRAKRIAKKQQGQWRLRNFMDVFVSRDYYWSAEGTGYKLMKDEPIDYDRYTRAVEAIDAVRQRKR